MIGRLLHRGRERPGHRRDGARFLLLVGTPGAGKRALGNYLAERSDYIHLDFGNRRIRRWVLDSGSGVLRGALRACRRERRGVVVSWDLGIGADQFEQLDRMRGLGFECLWFDADGGASRRAYLDASRSRTRSVRVIDAFDADGGFEPLERVACAALERPSMRPRLQPTLQRATRWLRQGGLVLERRVRAPVALGVGLAVTVASVSVAALFALPASGPAPQRQAAAAHATLSSHTPGALPSQGELVPGRSLAGVALGDTKATVREVWGQRYRVCDGCSPQEWFYFLPGSNPAGAGVEFQAGKVVAVFTLGSPFGWHTDTGLKVGAFLPTPKIVHPTPRFEACEGYGAQSSAPEDGAVTSILTQGPAVYGFELSRPSLSPCI